MRASALRSKPSLCVDSCVALPTSLGYVQPGPTGRVEPALSPPLSCAMEIRTSFHVVRSADWQADWSLCGCRLEALPFTATIIILAHSWGGLELIF